MGFLVDEKEIDLSVGRWLEDTIVFESLSWIFIFGIVAEDQYLGTFGDLQQM